MPYIYKYVNKDTKETEYVGIVKKDDGLTKRLIQHKRDAWFYPLTYEIYYTYVETQTDAEALEAHFIALYESYKYHNKAKSGWGQLSFAPTVKWKLYEDSIDKPTSSRTVLDRYIQLRERLYIIDAETKRLRDEADWVLRRIADEEKEIAKFNRASIRSFFRSNYNIADCGIRMSSEELFSKYNEWWEENDDAAIFDEVNDFWETILDMYDFRYCIEGDYIKGVVHKDYWATGRKEIE